MTSPTWNGSKIYPCGAEHLCNNPWNIVKLNFADELSLTELQLSSYRLMWSLLILVLSCLLLYPWSIYFKASVVYCKGVVKQQYLKMHPALSYNGQLCSDFRAEFPDFLRVSIWVSCCPRNSSFKNTKKEKKNESWNFLVGNREHIS